MNAPHKLTAINGGRALDAPQFDLSDLIPEKDVPEKYPGIFAVDELAKLRRAKKIGCFQLSAQRIFYRDSDLKAYIKAFYQPAETPADNGDAPCHDEDNHSSNIGNSGSTPSPTVPASTDTGAKAEESAAASLMLQTSTTPKLKSSPLPNADRSSRGHRRP